MLVPIAGENPGGVDLRWDPVYQQIRDTRPQGDRDMLGSGEPQAANWPLVVDLCSQVLADRSKDLMVAGWLTEALVNLHGFAGLRDGLRLIRGLLEQHWDHLYPAVEDGDFEPRAAPLIWLTDADRGARLPNRLRDVPFTPDKENIYSWHYWKSRFPSPKGNDEKDKDFERRRQEAEGRAKSFEDAMAKLSREHTETLHQDLQQSLESLSTFEQAAGARLGPLAPGTTAMRQALSDCEALVRRIVKDKGGAGEAAAANGQVDAAPNKPAAVSVSVSVSGPIQTRDEAFRRLAEVAAFLRQTEPQSPVSYLIERAVVWGRMPFEQLLGELIKDTGVRGQVGELLGIRAADLKKPGS
ncbi:MAG TPA: type VI secretion system protein TssA [Pirellulales bacterium]